jgi:G3E family GTPase
MDFCDIRNVAVGRDPIRWNRRLSGSRPDGDEHEHASDHQSAFDTWSYETDGLLSLETLRQTARKLPGGVFRCKGIIRSVESPDRPAVLQVVGRRVELSLLDKWNGMLPGTRIVAIGATGSFDGVDLHQRFAACIVS